MALYTLNLDDDNFVLSISQTPESDIELDLKNIDTSHISAYQFIDGVLVENAAKMAELIDEENQHGVDEEISFLEKELTDTDYICARCFEEIMALDKPLTFISDMIAILIKYSKQYKEVIAQRKVWRARIEELRDK